LKALLQDGLSGRVPALSGSDFLSLVHEFTVAGFTLKITPFCAAWDFYTKLDFT
jgi:hypothetical protein